MGPQRWARIQAAFDALVSLDGAARETALGVLGVEDAALRDDVQALLRADLDAGASTGTRRSFDTGTDVELHARLDTALGERYSIVRPLGQGAMGFVYLVRDRKHDRLIALKVLLPDVVGALGSTHGVERFLREMRIAARLSHPHIVPLYDSGEAGGLLYYTMPFVAGESLRDRLRRERQLPVDVALAIARDVLAALDFAHRQAVVHRDIKPENILLEDGGALVADFGVALALTPAAGERLTATGLSVGTPTYMAPEQVTGDPHIDGRADLFAVSAVLYEMLCGEPPHHAATVQAVIAKVLSENASPVRRARPSVPHHVASAIERGLSKLPADRWQSAGALADALMAGTPDPSQSPNERSRRLSARARVLLLVVGVAGVVTAVAAMRSRSPENRVAPMSFELVLPDSAAPQSESRAFPFATSIALSPDGSTIAYVGGKSRSVFVRTVDELLARRIAGTEDAHCPSFSPDGRWIAFISQGRLLKIPIAGGRPTMVADSALTCAVWTDRNEILFDGGRQLSKGASCSCQRALFRVAANGGPVVLVAAPDPSKRIGELVPSQALPGGKSALIFLSEKAGYLDWQIGLVTLADGKIRPLTPPGTARYRPLYADGHVLYAENSSVMAAPFSLRTLRITGPAVTLLHDTITDFGASSNGDLVYVSGRGTQSLVAVNERGVARVLAGNPDALRSKARAVNVLDTAYYSWPRLSPDGKRVALEVKTGTRSWDVWVYDIGAHALTRLTDDFTGNWPAGWTADGRSVVFFGLDSAGLSYGDRPRRIMVQRWDGAEPRREFIRLPGPAFDLSVGPPHGYVAYTPSFRIDDIWIAPLDTPQAARPLLATPAIEMEPRLSPDGTLLAYVSSETNRLEVYVRSLSPGGSRVQVSTDGGRDPVWSADGRQLYYRGAYVMRATLGRGPDIAVLRRDTLFKDVYATKNVANFDVFPGGRELLMIRENPAPLHATIMINWPELVRRSGTPPY